ncbi:hypothetical protein GCM10027073_32890 [Streptomyces chlorus]
MHKGRQNSSGSAAPDDGPFRSWLRALSEELGTELEGFLDSDGPWEQTAISLHDV